MSTSLRACTERRRREAQTLLEVMLAVTILSLLLGIMMSLVTKSIEAAALLERTQQQVEQRQGMVDLMRVTFRTLPNNVQMISRRVTDANSIVQQQLVFANGPSVIAWGGADEVLHSSAILGTPQQLGGALTLAVKRVLPPETSTTQSGSPLPNSAYLAQLPEEGSSQDTAQWLTLLEKIKTIQWRFFDPRTVAWLDDWTDPNTRPSLAELTIQYMDEEIPQRYVFWLPPVTPNALPKFTGRATTNSNSNRSGTGNSGNGGNNGGGNRGSGNGGNRPRQVN